MSDLIQNFQELVRIIAKLRDPNGGCPWDLEQTHSSLKQYLIEESYEVLDAIDNAPDKLKEELGDVLLQVVLHSQVAKDNGTFELNDVIKILNHKMISRHPHVFGEIKVDSSDQVVNNWEKIKSQERASKNENSSALEGIPRMLPGLQRAQRMGEKAARTGFDWPDAKSAFEKVAEELEEFKQAAPKSSHAEEEFGDLLFAIAQWGRKLGYDVEGTMGKACQKFSDRFRLLEKKAGPDIRKMSLEQLETIWQECKGK